MVGGTLAPVCLYPQQNGSVNLEKAKKDLFAMIQQLGPAILFCSFSVAETKWIELLKMLWTLVDTKDHTNEQL